MATASPSGAHDLTLDVVDLHETAFACLRAIQRHATRKRLHVCHEVTMPAPTIAADERQIVEAIVGLLMVVVRWTPDEGQVGIAVEAPATDEPAETAALTVWGTGGRASDEGGEVERARRIIERHRGTMVVHDEPGGPTRFVMTLPSSPAVRHSRRPRPMTGTPRVLVVEDDETNVTTLLDYLRAHGFEVAVAENGLHGIALARHLLPDAIIMDVHLPGMNGLDAMRAIRRDPSCALRETPIFALTASAMPGDRERCLDAGADEYWTKPASLRLLTAAIEDRVRRERHAAPEWMPGTW